MTPLNEVKEYVKQYSGTLKENFVQSDNVEEEPNLPEEDGPTIPDNGDDENKKEETISNQTIIFNAFAEEKFSSNKTNNGITITYKDGKTAEIGSIENCTINGQQITKIVKFGGGGNYSQLSIQFTTTKKANITVYYAINKDNRHAALYNEEGLVEEADVNTTLDGSIKNYTFKNLPAGNYATTSAGSGLNFYAIVIEYID